MHRSAADAIIESRLIHMSPAGFAAFLEALSAPPSVVPEIVELGKRKAPWEREAGPRPADY